MLTVRILSQHLVSSPKIANATLYKHCSFYEVQKSIKYNVNFYACFKCSEVIFQNARNGQSVFAAAMEVADISTC